MTSPLLSIIIPTYNRPELLAKAITSALGQSLDDLEVIVVDDASESPVEIPADPRVRLIRLSPSGGGAAARNAGTEAAQGRWVTYLDDDDCLLPEMAETSLKALGKTHLSQPVGVISGIEVVNAKGKPLAVRLPPPLRECGKDFALEDLETGCSYNTKQTLVVEKAVIQQIGGWDVSFRSRVHSDLFLRLNPVCSLIGLPVVTYQLRAHSGPRVSKSPTLRQESFQRLVTKHRAQFEAHPRMFADFVFGHAIKTYEAGELRSAIAHLLWAICLHPGHILLKKIPQTFWWRLTAFFSSN